MSAFRVRNLTPFPYGAFVTSTQPPQPEMVLVVRGRFDLHQGAPASVTEPPEPGLDALSQGPLTGDMLYEDDEERVGELLYASDFAHLKPRTDVLFRGSAHAPLGQVERCPVSIVVGAWQKSLWVIGDRTWTGGTLSEAPSAPQPFSTKPIRYARAFGGVQTPTNPLGRGPESELLPNVEYAQHLIRRRGDRPPPAGLGPLNPEWPQRRLKRGKEYGADYLRDRAPYFSRDFEWTYFNAAPEDQQIPGYLRGDEIVRLQNLLSDHALLETRLPGLRVRAFVNDRESRFREVPLVLDTLFIDGDAGQLLLTWRGRTPVQDPGLEDITAALIVSEPLDQAPVALSERQATLAAFEADPLELSIPEDLQALVDAREAGDTEAEAAAIATLIESNSSGATATIEERGSLGADEDLIPPAVPMIEDPRVSLGLRTEVLEEMITALAERDPQRAAKLSADLSREELTRLDPTYRPPGSPRRPTDAPGPGADLRGRDLTGADLREADLRGANLEGATLTGAKLRGADLTGARLAGAVLYRADLRASKLARADLSRVNAAKARLEAADLSGATLTGAYFAEAVMPHVCLEDCTGDYPSFAGADLTSARARRASFDRAAFEEAKLDGADFEEARLPGAMLHRSSARGARFLRSHLDGSGFDGADLSGANFREGAGERTAWEESILTGADLSHVTMRDAHFTKARANGACFVGAELSGARFFKSDLANANFEGANLKSADLSRSDVSHASFRGAHLYDAKFIDARGEGTLFTNAILTRCLR